MLSGADQEQMHFFCPDSMCIVIPGFHKTEQKGNSYLVGTSKKNIGTDSASWMWCQDWTAKARPANVTCPVAAAHSNSDVAMAWNLGFVHSITERKENESWLPIKVGRTSRSKPKLGKCPSKALTYWASHCLSKKLRRKPLPGNVVCSRWGRWGQVLHRFQWQLLAVKHKWRVTSSQT